MCFHASVAQRCYSEGRDVMLKSFERVADSVHTAPNEPLHYVERSDACTVFARAWTSIMQAKRSVIRVRIPRNRN